MGNNNRRTFSDMIKMLAAVSLAVLLVVPCMGLHVYDSDSAIHEAIIESLREFEIHKDLEDQLGDQQHAVQHTSVCYDDLGCFEKNGTFKHLKQLPDTPENVGTQFLLYTKNNRHDPQIIDYREPETIFSSNFNKKFPVKVMTHGFGGRNNLTWLWNLKNAFLEVENVNVIVVDWSIGAQAPYYIAAVVNTELVGAQIAAMLFFLKDNLGIHERNMHVIGFSLGAQVAGFVGKRMQKLRRIKPSRITGLDPAAPLFADHGGKVHLFKDDADYVDVVHTNADLLIYGGVGMEVPIGHVDYYPNGGKRQPGCGSTIAGVFVDIFTNDRQKACNHERAVHLFTESILKPLPCHFVSHPCENYSDFQLGKCMNCEKDLSDCGIMGYTGHGKGVYYFMTVGEQPYCALNLKVEVKFSAEQKKKKTYGQIVVTLVGKGGVSQNITMSKKDEKLVPDSSHAIVVPLSPYVAPIKEVRIIYVKYKGWFTEGADYWKVDSVSVSDYGKFLFAHCGKGTILHTMEEVELESTGHPC